MNVMCLGENECVWWIKWKLWLMVSCGFLENGEKDYRTGTKTRREASGIER